MFAIKSGADKALDLAREAFSQCSEAVYELCEEYKSTYDLPALKVNLALECRKLKSF